MDDSTRAAAPQQHEQFRFVARSASRVSRGIGPRWTVVTVLALGLIVMTAAAWLFSVVYAAVTDEQSVALLDEPALAMAIEVRSPWLDGALTAFTNIAGTVGLSILGGVVVGVLAWRRREWAPFVLGLTAGAGSLLMTLAGKELFGRDRPPRSEAVPPYETSASFPSGHTLNATVVAGIIAYLLIVRQAQRILRVTTITCAAVLAVTIGLSRVYLGHHWLTDVVAAWLLALAWLAVVITADRLWLRLRDGEPGKASQGRTARATAD
jgi:membrane-associated phospholipid phosphatase